MKPWAVPKLAVDPSWPTRVIAGTRGDSVWVSEDFGESWKKPNYGKPGPGKVRCVTIDPEDPDTLYAGTEFINVFVSHDLAKSWTRLVSVCDVPTVEPIGYPVATVEPHVRHISLDMDAPQSISRRSRSGTWSRAPTAATPGRSWTSGSPRSPK